ncbi:MAG: hypothetical protein AAGI24_12530 [Pseudomonadota bacterium]
MTHAAIPSAPISPVLLTDISTVLNKSTRLVGVEPDQYALMYQSVAIYNMVLSEGLVTEDEQFDAAEKLIVCRCNALRAESTEIH